MPVSMAKRGTNIYIYRKNIDNNDRKSLICQSAISLRADENMRDQDVASVHLVEWRLNAIAIAIWICATILANDDNIISFLLFYFPSRSVSLEIYRVTECRCRRWCIECALFSFVHWIYYHIWPKGSNCAYLQNASIAAESVHLLLFSWVFISISSLFMCVCWVDGAKRKQTGMDEQDCKPELILIENKRMIKNKSKIQTRIDWWTKIDTKKL